MSTLTFTKNVAVLVLIALLLILGLYTPWVPPSSTLAPPPPPTLALTPQDLQKEKLPIAKPIEVQTTPSQDLPKKQETKEKEKISVAKQVQEQTTPHEAMQKNEETKVVEKGSGTTSGLGRSALLTSTDQNKTTTSCKYLPELLVGRCWGLTGINEKHFSWGTMTKRSISNAMECETLCCDMGDKCITYQWLNEKKMCHIGKHVRLGKEGGSVGEWCEPLPPAKWNGRKRILPQLQGTAAATAPTAGANAGGTTERKRDKKCEWGEPLPRQCWHLGPERMNSTNGRLGPRGCAAGCCANKHCVAWQQLPGTSNTCHFDKPFRIYPLETTISFDIS